MTALSNYLTELRTSRGLLQKQLASELGVHPAYVSNLESGNRISLGSNMIGKLRKALVLSEVEVDKLLELREIAKGHLSVSRNLSAGELEALQLLASSVGRLPAENFRLISELIRTWLPRP